MSDQNSSYTSDNLPENLKLLISQHLDELKTAKSKNSDLFETQINYIAGGALSISPFIIEKVIDMPSAKYKAFLFIGWAFIILALLTGLSCAYFASKWFRKSISELTAALHGMGNFDANISNRRSNRIEKLNLGTMVSLFTGILFFFTFISLNISKMSDKKNIPLKPNVSSDQTKGHTVSNLPNITIQNTPVTPITPPTSSNNGQNSGNNQTNYE